MRAEGRTKENARRPTCYEESCAVGFRDTEDRGGSGAGVGLP